MLDWMCCNLCTSFSDEPGASPFYTTSCKHIACNKCVTKGRMSPVCGFCKKSAQVKRIDELTGDAKLLFEDPRVAMEKYTEEAMQAIKFQQKNELALLNKLWKDKEKAERELKEKDELLAASIRNTVSRSTNTAAASASRTTPRSSVLAEPPNQSLRENVTSSRYSSSAAETPRNLNTSRDSYLYKTPADAGSSGASASKSTSSLQMIRNAGKKSVFNVVPLSSASSVRPDFGERDKRQLRDPLQARVSHSVALPPRHSPYGSGTQKKQNRTRFV